MKTAPPKKFIKVFLFISIILSISIACFGQSEEEMQMLRLFYNEKDLVITATRNPKPITQVAENITVITSSDIEAMNAHSVAEVLDSVPGLFLSTNRDFGAFSLLNIQGSEPRHTLVLVDEIPWNLISEGSAETITVPVGIIERIEIIKGPASSAWGSSLGGVVNIITKSTGTSSKPGGSIYASYGKKNSQDYRIDLHGKIGKAGYYLYGGTQDSDGLVQSRFSDNKRFYSKIEIPFSGDVKTGLSMGYSDTQTGFGDYLNSDINISGSLKTFYTSPFVSATVAKGLDISLSAYYIQQESAQTSNSLGLGITGDPGELYLGTKIKDESLGARFQAMWKKEINSLVFGMDIGKGEYDQSLYAGSLLQSIGVPIISEFSPDNTTWAIYINDTISSGAWSVTPGIRYDHETITGSFISPSLGLTYLLSKDTVLRGTIARGFSAPGLSWTSGGGMFLDPNPSLKYEEVWSYQAGAESAFSFMWLKANIFLHELKNSLTGVPLGGGPPAYNDIIINNGEIKRKGVEIEAESLPIYNFSFKGGLSYVDINPPNAAGSSKIYSIVAGLKYQSNTISGQLLGYYNWHDLNNIPGGSSDDFIWDISISKIIKISEGNDVEFFAVGRNMFNGSQYSYIENINPRRWFELGIKYRF
ncbi:MAG: TonB-dependent receptor [Deltaproteobacteria bacterium]|nr:TonB-dependent receptor [Deltaproteobacteria bacterium]